MLTLALLAILSLEAAEPAGPNLAPRRMSCRDPAEVALARSGPDGRRELRARLVAEPDACLRLGVAQALVESGPEGRSVVLEELRSTTDGEVRRACIGALPTGDPAVVPDAVRWLPLPGVETVDVLTDVPFIMDSAMPLPPGMTVEQHAWQLATTPGAATRDALVGLLSSPDAELRRRAAWALRVRANQPGFQEEAKRTEALFASLGRDADAVVRLAAVAWQCPRPSEEGDPAARVAHARQLLEDEDPLVRHAGLVLLGCDSETAARLQDLKRLRELARDAGSPMPSRARAAALAVDLQPSLPEVTLLAEQCIVSMEPSWCQPGKLALVEPPGPHVSQVKRLLSQLTLVPGPAQAGAEEALRRMSR